MKYLITIAVLIMIIIILVSCGSSTNLVDNDDLYIQKRDTIITKRIVKRYALNYNYYTPNYGWYGWGHSYGYPYQYYRPTTIIVVPKSEPEFKYGKRPDREGNGGVGVPLGRRRGRD